MWTFSLLSLFNLACSCNINSTSLFLSLSSTISLAHSNSHLLQPSFFHPFNFIAHGQVQLMYSLLTQLLSLAFTCPVWGLQWDGSSKKRIEFRLKMSGACIFSALIRLNPTTNIPIPDQPHLCPIAKYLDEIFPTRRRPFEAPTYPTLTGPVSGPFYVRVCY